MSNFKTRSSGFGKFLLGALIGFLLCVGLIVGLGFYVYNNLSVHWINNTFKTEVDLGSDELNNKTIKEFIAGAVSLMNNIDNYTLSKLKEDFGLDFGMDIMGIDFSDIEDVAVTDIGDAIQDKFSNISAEELKELFDLSDMNKILNKTNTYYVKEGKLYEDAGFTTEVDFAYAVSGTEVLIKNKEVDDIVNNQVEIELRYLPLTTALSDFMNTMGDRITVGELVDPVNGYGVQLPAYLSNTAEKKAKTINELQSIINDVTVADVLGYTNVGGVYYDGTTPVTGIMKAIAGKQVDEIAGTIDTLKLTDIFESEDFTSGALSLIENPESVLINDVASVLTETIKTKKLFELKDAGLITQEVDVEIQNTKTSHDGKNLKNLTINDAVVVLIDILNALKVSA